MALVNIVNMSVLDNPTNFLSPFQFEITFECLQELQDDLEWKVLYVGSADDTLRDQVLEEVLVGPVPVGINKFILQADPPEPERLPPNDIVGVTVVLVTCSYREREFVRVGYYVNNEYVHPDYKAQCAAALEAAAAAAATNSETAAPPTLPSPPSYPTLQLQYVQRHILHDKPRITKFPIPWDKDAEAAADSVTTSHEAATETAATHDGENDDDQQQHNDSMVMEDVQNPNDEEDDEDDDEEDEEDGDNEKEIDLEEESNLNHQADEQNNNPAVSVANE